MRHAECGTLLRVENAVLENGETWCPGCKTWFVAGPETLTENKEQNDE